MKLHTISPYQTTAEAFFTQLAQWHTDMVVDVRLHNTTQLDGFSKAPDIGFFCRRLLNANYAHDTDFSPDADTLGAYLHHKTDWDTFSADFKEQMEERHAIPLFLERYGEYDSVALIGTATKTRRSHVEVLEELITAAQKPSASQTATALGATAATTRD